MKIKIVFFDCDGVLLFGNPWEKIHQMMGVTKEQDKKWLDAYYNGEDTFKRWNENVENHYRKITLSKDRFKDVLNIKNYKINPQAQDLISYLKSAGIKTAIISGGIDYYVSQVAKHFNIENWSSNFSFIFDQNGLFTNIKYLHDDPEAKVNAAKKILGKMSISHLESIFVGDSRNDIEAFKFTQRGILYNHTDPKIEQFAWKKVDNLKKIIPIIEEENGNI